MEKFELVEPSYWITTSMFFFIINILILYEYKLCMGAVSVLKCSNRTFEFDSQVNNVNNKLKY